jgi:hypothetical protein
MTFDEILDKLTDSCHFVIIKRKSMEEFDNNGEDYYEVGFSTITDSPDYFLFVFIKEDVFETLQKETEWLTCS